MTTGFSDGSNCSDDERFVEGILEQPSNEHINNSKLFEISILTENSANKNYDTQSKKDLYEMIRKMKEDVVENDH